MKKYAGYISRQFDSQQFGNPDVGQTVTVREYLSQTEDGAIATIYSDNGINETPNPFSADDKGRFDFYAANGRYVIEFGAPVISSQTVRDISLFDSADFDGGVEEAPINSNKYARKDADWEIAQDFVDAPITGDIFGRKDGQWEAINGVTYPSKVGDTYVSNSGAISVTDHFALDGVDRLIADWPLIAGTSGFPILPSELISSDNIVRGINPPSGFSSSRRTMTNSDGSLHVQISSSVGFIAISEDANRQYTQQIATPEQMTNMIIPLKSPNTDFMIFANTGRIYIFNSSSKTFTDTFKNTGMTGGYGGGQSGMDYNSTLSVVYKTIGQCVTTNLSTFDSTVNTFPMNSGDQIINYYTIFKDWVYASYRNINAGTSGIYRTQDFVTKEVVLSTNIALELRQIHSTDDYICFLSRNEGKLFTSFDGDNFNEITGSLVLGSTSTLLRIDNLSSNLIIDTNGSTGFVISSQGLLTNIDLLTLGNPSTCCFDTLTSEVVFDVSGSASDKRYEVEISGTDSFSVPLVPDLTFGHKYYVKGK